MKKGLAFLEKLIYNISSTEQRCEVQEIICARSSAG